MYCKYVDSPLLDDSFAYVLYCHTIQDEITSVLHTVIRGPYSFTDQLLEQKEAIVYERY